MVSEEASVRAEGTREGFLEEAPHSRPWKPGGRGGANGQVPGCLAKGSDISQWWGGLESLRVWSQEQPAWACVPASGEGVLE